MATRESLGTYVNAALPYAERFLQRNLRTRVVMATRESLGMYVNANAIKTLAT
jgi:hypothetical protein